MMHSCLFLEKKLPVFLNKEQAYSRPSYLFQTTDMQLCRNLETIAKQKINLHKNINPFFSESIVNKYIFIENSQIM